MTRVWLAGSAIAVLAAIAGVATHRGLERRYAEARPTMPAVDHEVFGLRLGHSSLAEVQAFAAERGFFCQDASMAKIMAARPQPDAISSASAKKRAARRTNPQVRLACAAASAQRLDPALPASTGRLLFVFDAADAPLRTISYQRTYPNHDLAAGLADARASEAWLARSYGQPGVRRGDLGEELAFLAPVARGWERPRLHVGLTAVRYPKAGLVISQDVGVPFENVR